MYNTKHKAENDKRQKELNDIKEQVERKENWIESLNKLANK